VPAPFNDKAFSFASEINAFLEKNGASLADVKIQFEGEGILRPPYRSDVFHPQLVTKEFTVNSEKVAVGWLLTQRGKAKLRAPNKGIFFKKKGFTIGDEYLVENQTEKSYSEWQYGEIHIVSEKIRENAARNNFEANSEAIQPLLDQVAEFVNQLQKVNQYQSQKIQSPLVKKANESYAKGDPKSANALLTKAKKNLATKRTFASEPSLQVMKPIIDAKSNEDKIAVASLENKLKQKKPAEELIAKKKERLMMVIEDLPPSLKDHYAKLTMKGKPEPEISMLEKLVELLKDKTGSTDNELHNLSRFAYGWKEIAENPAPRVLTITGASIDYRDKERNLEFGIMIHALQHIFVDAKKHGVGKDSFKWFEHLSEADKLDVMTELYATVGLVYRMIEKSEINQT
jgi:hypothetical protein